MSDPVQLIPGYSVRRTPRSGFHVIELDYWADEEKDAAWAAELRSRMGEKKFRREFLRDWTTSSGDAFYPEFVLNREKYIRPCEKLLNAPICRGWDFGFRKPGVVWFQYSEASRRAWAIREWSPENIETDTYRDVVLYLSGQLYEEQLDHHSLRFVQQIKADPKYPDPPWFESHPSTEWLDFAGPEALSRRAEVSRDSQEKCNADILATAGIILTVYSVPVSGRELVIRRLLKDREDGNPGLLFDPACPLLISGFSGGIAYPKPTKAHPHPTDPAKDGVYDHVHDALGYGLVNVVPVDEAAPRVSSKPSQRHAPSPGVYSRQPVDARDAGDLNLMELRGRWPLGQ